MNRTLAQRYAHRHPSIVHILQYFGYEHLQNENARSASRFCHELAVQMLEMSDDNPELTVALRKLLESKDAFVRSVLVLV